MLAKQQLHKFRLSEFGLLLYIVRLNLLSVCELTKVDRMNTETRRMQLCVTCSQYLLASKLEKSFLKLVVHPIEILLRLVYSEPESL